MRAREPDGYHRLETLFAFAEQGDRLTGSASNGFSLSITGPFAGALSADEDNLVLRAARALQRATGTAEGAALLLDKRLPVASGIGGGSADAAAALRLLNRLWDLRLTEDGMEAIAGNLGADVPACVASRSARGEGRGDRLTPSAPAVSGMPLLLVNPGVALSTAAVFARWDRIDRGPLSDDYAAARNDLEPPATALAPQIADVLTVLRALAGVKLARMSGSGATCFALFECTAARDEAASRIVAGQPHWWRLASCLR